MPSGDAQRVWFPGMVEVLKTEWIPSMTWSELADLCARVTAWRAEYRQSHGIRPPLHKCSKCGTVSRADIEGVSIRSALFELKKIGIISEEEFKRLDKDWMKHRAAQGLDPYGRKLSASPSVPDDADSPGG